MSTDRQNTHLPLPSNLLYVTASAKLLEEFLWQSVQPIPLPFPGIPRLKNARPILLPFGNEFCMTPQRACWISVLVCTCASLFVALPSNVRGDDFKETFLPFSEKYCVRCHNNTEARGELNLSRYTEARQVTQDFRRWQNIIQFIRHGEMPPEDEKQPTLEERKVVIDKLQALLFEEAKKHAGDPGAILPRRLSNTEYDRSIRDLTGVDIRPTHDFPADPAAGEGFDNTSEALGMSPSLLKKYLLAAQHVSDHLVLKTNGITFAPFPVTSYNERKKLAEQAIIDFYQSHTVKIGDYLEAAWRYRHRAESEKDQSIAAWGEKHGLSSKYLSLVWETLSAAKSETGYLKQLGEHWDSLPPPTDATSRPAELAAIERWIDLQRQSLTFKEEELIRANAGNWPIAHLDFRAKTARQRDQFDPARLSQTRTLLRMDRLNPPGDKNKIKESPTLYLRVSRGADDGMPGTVFIRRAVFTKANHIPGNPEEAKQHETISLRDALQQHLPELAAKLNFGKGPAGEEIAPDSFALTAPALLEIPLTADFFHSLNGKQLLLECELDPQHKECSVWVKTSVGKQAPADMTPQSQLLMRGDSELAKSLAPSAEKLCRTFPNRFFYVDNERGLAAGFHLVEGFFRDDLPLKEKVLREEEIVTLDKLWQELDFITQSTETLLRGFVWFERAERHMLHDARFDFVRSDDPQLIEEEMLTRFEKAYLEKLGVKLNEETGKPEKGHAQYDLVHGFFEDVKQGLAHHQQQLTKAEEAALNDLWKLTERAYRRQLKASERESLQQFYSTLRKRGQSVESSLRGLFTAVLMSPDFFFHVRTSKDGPGVYPLSSDALASRLSYFLWSSIPDAELLQSAASGKLSEEAELQKQTRRMLADDRMDAFSREFLGQWLRYRDYLSKDAINAPGFPGYDEPLRQAMFEEPTHFMKHLVQNDLPITALLHSDTTFVNGILAKHYGGEIEKHYQAKSKNPAEWHQVSGLRTAGRGGLFGMGVILTKSSKGERTSPIKRGFWTVHHLLGQHFPPPPADVPELPANEKQAAQTIRELIVAHTTNPKCAMCHTHFDGLGMALEGFDPIGRARSNDLAGRPIDDTAHFPGGETGKGIPGLIDYIEKHRRQEFVQTFCRKFLGYALGRSVLLSDQPLLNEMEAALEANNYRISVLFDTVLRSPQFRMQRGSDFVASDR